MELQSTPKPDVTGTPQQYERGRGRHAEKPSQLPRPGWLDILWRTNRRLQKDNLSIVAAGVAFYGFVAVIPALGAMIALFGLLSDPQQFEAQINGLVYLLPSEVLPLLEEQMKRIISNYHAASVSALVGTLIALYSSASATKALMAGLNVAYDEHEKRSYIKATLFAVFFAFAAVVVIVAMITLVAVLPVMLKSVGVTDFTEQIISWARWPILALVFMTGLACVYRFAPSRRAPKWEWVSWGAATATCLWLAGSALFSFYVSKLGRYDKTYGSLGAVVVFLFWLYLSAYAVLLGAELNSEMERQTVKDTTVGKPKPLGERGATAADTVGPRYPARKKRA